MLGMERDNDLWMRGHVGTRDGRKGSAPLGRNYFLSNWEIDKRIYHNGFFSLKLSPFLDTGKITDPLAGIGLRAVALGYRSAGEIPCPGSRCHVHLRQGFTLWP